MDEFDLRQMSPDVVLGADDLSFLSVFTPKSSSLCFGGRILVPAGKVTTGPFERAPSKSRGLV